MNGDSRYWLKETYRYLELALISASEEARNHIEEAIKCLEKYEKENKK